MTKLPAFIENMDWKLLRQQKQGLVEIQTYLEKFDMDEKAEVIEGILNGLDAIQDWAVDELGLPADEVFDRSPAESLEEEVPYGEWEQDVTRALEDIAEVSTSDAQGIMECQEFILTQCWGKALSPIETADLINTASLKV